MLKLNSKSFICIQLALYIANCFFPYFKSCLAPRKHTDVIILAFYRNSETTFICACTNVELFSHYRNSYIITRNHSSVLTSSNINCLFSQVLGKDVAIMLSITCEQQTVLCQTLSDFSGHKVLGFAIQARYKTAFILRQTYN
jgi:hypothetical protein